MTYFVSPTSEKRQRQWERAYGRSQLPVKFAHPHVACTQRWGDVPVYYLDISAVPDALLDRIATFEARRLGISYHQARLSVRTEWLIRADGCQVDSAEVVDHDPLQRSFPFFQHVPLRVN